MLERREGKLRGEGEKWMVIRKQPNPHFLIKHLQYLSARTALEQTTMRLKALDRFCAPLCRAEVERRVFRRVVLARLRQRRDDVVNLEERR